jgi:hypothetical protein
VSLTLSLGEQVEVKGRRMTVTPKAYDCLPKVRDRLIEIARAGGTTTYGRLVADLGLPYLPRGLGRLLDLLSEDCSRRHEPSLAALVVSDSTGEVGADFDGDAASMRGEVYAHWG